MSTVVLTIRTGDFSSQMAAMRDWLSGRRCEPSKFTYNSSADGVFTVQLDFQSDDEAEAFDRRFNSQNALPDADLA